MAANQRRRRQGIGPERQVSDYVVATRSNRLKVFPAQSEIERKVRPIFPIILGEESQITAPEGSVVGDWSSGKVFVDSFEDWRVVSKVPGTDKRIVGTRTARTRVVIQIQPVFATEFPAHVIADLGQNVAELELSLMNDPRRVFRAICAKS